ncbi:MAG TPA: 3-deoxy-manno-octulosonate cytidylyltransferase [Elusimicrobiota bacterium]|nr:3-deoxy-manno-octulosonate cytidylyltransferase [Elusimicrobiota bacterium]
MIDVLGVIPARYASQRFPGKPLKPVAGRPLLQWVHEAARKALRHVVVATDDRRILDFVKQTGGQAVLTSSRCKSGTDRVAEVARRIPAKLYLNIQGDEPLMSARTIRRVVALHKDKAVRMGTAATFLRRETVWRDPNNVKVLVGQSGRALYFSRAPIPFFRNPDTDFHPAVFTQISPAGGRSTGGVYKHLGIYSYTAELLRRFVRWPESVFEKAERLEQLRALENGVDIAVALTPDDSIGVDVPADAVKVEVLLRKGHVQ